MNLLWRLSEAEVVGVSPERPGGDVWGAQGLGRSCCPVAGAHPNFRMLKGRLHGAEGRVRYCPYPGETGNVHWFLTGNNSASPGLLRATLSCGQRVTRNRRLRHGYRNSSLHHYPLFLLIAPAHSCTCDSDPNTWARSLRQMMTVGGRASRKSP